MSYMSEWKNYYRLSPGDLSQSSIKTLRWTSLVGLVSSILGLLMLWRVIPLNLFTGLSLALGLLFGFIALVNRLPSLLSMPGKHLDEWGNELKKNAEAFTYRVVFYFLFFMLIITFAFLGSDISDLRLVLTPTFEQLGFSLVLLPLLLQFITSSHLAWSVKPLSDEDVKEMSEIESPRKAGKWMTIIAVAFILLGGVGGKVLDKQYMHMIDDASQTCVITMETEVPLVQLKNLNDCKTLKQGKAEK